MKKILILICLCLIGFQMMGQYGTQFANRGFETWANFNPYNNNTIEPEHWHSTKSATGTFNGFLSQQVEPSDRIRPGSKGSKSARIWPRSVVGVTANGNLTNGRMNAGSMSANGSGNYNYTQRSDERFNTPIRRVPDSLSVWVCFRCADPEQQAEARAVVHGDADFKFIANGTVEPLDARVAVATKHFLRTSEAAGNYAWRRLSIPFEQVGPSSDPRYLLFTITTNAVPGNGGTSDDLFVDDILLIYNPTLNMGLIEKDHFHLGETLSIPFELEGTMSAENLNEEPNQLIVQLSQANGSFSNPIELGRVSTNESGTITVSIPMTIPTGNHYRIRLVTTNYPMISSDNGFDLSISSGAAVAEQQVPSLQLFPNPARQYLHIAADQEVTKVDLFNLSGEKVLSCQLASKDHVISLNGLATGIYLVHCQLQQQTLYRKLIIQ